MSDKGPPFASFTMVQEAEELCKTEDNIWDVINQLSIPVEHIEDTRQQAKVKYSTEALTRAFLYQYVHGMSRYELAQKLEERVVLVNAFGFAPFEDYDHPPRQQQLNFAWQKFTPRTQRAIKQAGEAIAKVAVEHDVLAEALAAVELTSDDEADLDETDQRERAQKLLRLARQYVIIAFKSGRAEHVTYEDMDIWDMLASICQTQAGSAHSEEEYAWLTDDDVTCSHTNFLRVLKKTASSDTVWAEYESSKDFYQYEDPVEQLALVEEVIAELLEKFNDALQNILRTVKSEPGGPFDGRTTTVAIDTTHDQYHVWPWEDKEKGIPKEDYPLMVNGFKDSSDGEYKHGFEYMTITLVGDHHPPILLGVLPYKKSSGWEAVDGVRHTKAELVERLLDNASQFVDIDEVLLDRGFYSRDVYAAIDDRDMIYGAMVPTYHDDLENIDEIDRQDGVNAGVLHNVPLVMDNGQVHHYREYLYVPSTSNDADGKYTTFVTNRRWVNPEDAIGIVNRYSRRWDIENQYKSWKEILPRTSSKDFRVRYCRVLFACVMYNLWRLADFLLKVQTGRPIRSEPFVSFKTFVRALGDFLREVT